MRTEDGFADMHLVAPRLWVGGDLDTHVGATPGHEHYEEPGVDDHEDASTARAQAADLLARGITHVLDVRIEWDDTHFLARWAPGIVVRHLGIDDDGQRVPPAWFEQGTAFALAALEDPDAVVLAHCHAGINRGPSMGFAILLAQGWDPADALDAITAGRPQAQVAYALDALRWHHDRQRTPADQRVEDRAAVTQRLDTLGDVQRLTKG